MMTIKEFASLCDCNTQTLRYYDKIDLLKPIKVDQWSGYRYYEKFQAVDFVKIKNLQAADLSIEEIKVLLTMPDAKVYEVFDRKIAELAQKLERIKEIQQSYLTEKSKMEKLIQSASDYILRGVSDYSVLQEFGLSVDDGEAIIAMLKDYIENVAFDQLPADEDVCMVVNDEVIHGADQAADAFAALEEYDGTVLLGGAAIREVEGITAENSECLFECHGWKFVHEFIDNIPFMDKAGDYGFFFKLTEDKHTDGLEFPMFMIAAMLPKAGPGASITGCCIEHSQDGQNHFWLRRKK